LVYKGEASPQHQSALEEALPEARREETIYKVADNNEL